MLTGATWRTHTSTQHPYARHTFTLTHTHRHPANTPLRHLLCYASSYSLIHSITHHTCHTFVLFTYKQTSGQHTGLLRATSCYSSSYLVLDLSSRPWRVLHMNEPAIEATGMSILCCAALTQYWNISVWQACSCALVVASRGLLCCLPPITKPRRCALGCIVR